MNCAIPFNRFFQANFSKGQLLIDFLIYGERTHEYDEYIRQGIEDLIQNIDVKRYSVLLENMDSVLKEIHVKDSDFTDICLMILVLLSYVLSEGKQFLLAELEKFFENDITKLNSEIVNVRNYLDGIFDWYLGFHRTPGVNYGCRNKELRAVPFICSSGVFGYNTFLCLYFHNIAPIGIATNLNPKLHVIIGTTFEAADHDVRHYHNRYCMIPFQIREQYKEIYQQILEGYRELSAEEQLSRRKHLFFLFFLINEISIGSQRYVSQPPDVSYKEVKESIKRRFFPPRLDYMDPDKYRRKFLIETEDLVPVLVEDLRMLPYPLSEESFDPYLPINMGDYVGYSLLELLDLFQERFEFFQ